MRRRDRRGVLLLEAMIALAILGVAVLTFVAVTRASGEAVARAARADSEARAAARFIAAVSLWPRADLDRRLGERAEGRWRLRVSRSGERIYVVVLGDSSGHRELLRTALYREPGEDTSR